MLWPTRWRRTQVGKKEEAAVAAELEAKRAERRRLAERLEAEQRRGFWARLFGGSGE
jgi:hypothetical protein